MVQRTIALVDDDPIIVAMLADLFAEEGYRTFAIAEGGGAPGLIARERPDLVLLDLWMEERDSGWIVYDALRAETATAHIPIIVCSADIPALRRRAATLGARGDAAVEKPFAITDLLATVSRLIGPPGGASVACR